MSPLIFRTSRERPLLLIDPIHIPAKAPAHAPEPGPASVNGRTPRGLNPASRPDSDGPMPMSPVHPSDTARAPADRPGPATGGPGDLYLGHFGLAERPFSLLPDPDFLFWSPAHRRAHAILEYGVLTRAPITLITGEVGAGKTTLVHHLMRGLGDDVQVGLIANAQGSRGDLLRWVAMALGQPADPQATYVDLFAAFQRHLIAQYAAGRRVVLIFDEAQNLDRAMLEELRMLTNINSGKDELVQLILVGQPELRTIVRRPDMAQFAQRVAASFHLPAMDAKTLIAYVRHRLQVAGGRPGIFSADALRLIHEATGGVPRLVNQLCDLSLVYTYAQNRLTVTRRGVQRVLDDGVFFAAAIPDTVPADDARGDRDGT